MRTVSFSDPKLRNVLNIQFVNTYTNIAGDPTAGRSIKHRPNEPPGPCIRGNGKQNVQTIFMTPQGEIFHVATGYQSSEDLLEESQYALNLFNGMRNGSPAERTSLVMNAHRKRLSNPNPNQRGTFSEFDNVFTNMMPGQFGNRNGARNSAGSRTRNAIPGSDMMGRFTQMGVNADQQFCIDHPLMTCQELERDPTKLVGNGDSFFASSSGGTNLFNK